MGKLTDINVVARNEYGDTLGIVTPVSVTKEGIFTTTLPEEAVNKLLDYGVTLRANRVGREGFFSAKTLDELRKEIASVMGEALSRELVQEETVIKYQIKTAGSCYLDDDGEILPNGGWAKNKNYDTTTKGHWEKFTEYSDAMHMQQAKIQATELDLQRIDAERQLRIAIRQYLNTMETSMNSYNSASEAVSLAQKAYDIAAKSYKVGKSTITDMNDAQLTLTQASLQQSQAIYNFVVAKSNLEKTLGYDFIDDKGEVDLENM